MGPALRTAWSSLDNDEALAICTRPHQSQFIKSQTKCPTPVPCGSTALYGGQVRNEEHGLRSWAPNALRTGRMRDMRPLPTEVRSEWTHPLADRRGVSVLELSNVKSP